MVQLFLFLKEGGEKDVTVWLREGNYLKANNFMSLRAFSFFLFVAFTVETG